MYDVNITSVNSTVLSVNQEYGKHTVNSTTSMNSTSVGVDSTSVNQGSWRNDVNPSTNMNSTKPGVNSTSVKSTSVNQECARKGKVCLTHSFSMVRRVKKCVKWTRVKHGFANRV